MSGERLLRVEHTMGTVFSVDVRDRPTPRIEDALDEVARWLRRVDELFSTYRPQSQLSRLARHELALGDCDPLIREVLGRCEEMAERTDGWFSPYYAGTLDPTGLVKGWAVERASEILAGAGAVNTCVNGGGDIQMRGERAPGEPWRAGVSDPARPGELIAVVANSGTLGMATSGTAERGEHVYDPHTRAPVHGGLASVTVLAESLTEADVWATAAFAMGGARAHDRLEALPGVEALGVSTDRNVWRTSGFPGA
ncbi:MAG: FAD:protein FMN transferase [Kitasatospora sp.]|nr:FAD:protein FMN transferase [Kitasatospora sp.]